MEWYTGGYFKAANHRVAAPPDDQRNHTRMGVFYFAVPNDDDKASNRDVEASCRFRCVLASNLLRC
jgi:isopenicillin N synthase-like dioxygenase